MRFPSANAFSHIKEQPLEIRWSERRAPTVKVLHPHGKVLDQHIVARTSTLFFGAGAGRNLKFEHVKFKDKEIHYGALQSFHHKEPKITSSAP